MLRTPSHFLYQLLDLGHTRAVGRDGDGARIGVFVGEGVECGAGGRAGGRFAGCDVDFGTAGLEEAVEKEGGGEWKDEKGEGSGRMVPRCSVETEASGAAGYDGDFSGEGEDICEILELGIGFGKGHGGDFLEENGGSFWRDLLLCCHC